MDAAVDRIDLLERIREVIPTVITEWINKNPGKFHYQTLKELIIKRLKHPSQKIFRFAGWDGDQK